MLMSIEESATRHDLMPLRVFRAVLLMIIVLAFRMKSSAARSLES
jgi:hypothetical protein